MWLRGWMKPQKYVQCRCCGCLQGTVMAWQGKSINVNLKTKWKTELDTPAASLCSGYKVHPFEGSYRIFACEKGKWIGERSAERKSTDNNANHSHELRQQRYNKNGKTLTYHRASERCEQWGHATLVDAIQHYRRQMNERRLIGHFPHQQYLQHQLGRGFFFRGKLWKLGTFCEV